MRDSYGSQMSMFNLTLLRKPTLPQVMSIECRFQVVWSWGCAICMCMWVCGRGNMEQGAREFFLTFFPGGGREILGEILEVLGWGKAAREEVGVAGSGLEKGWGGGGGDAWAGRGWKKWSKRQSRWGQRSCVFTLIFLSSASLPLLSWSSQPTLALSS